MKLLFLAAILVSTSASAARLVKCQAVKTENPAANEIQSIRDIQRYDVVLESHGSSAGIVTRIDGNTFSKEKVGVYQSEGFGEETICETKTTDLIAVTGQLKSYSTCLVKKNPEKRAQAEWVVRKSLRVQSSSGCIPGEDYGCTSIVTFVEERPMLCTDTADLPSQDSSATQAAIDSDPCNPNRRDQ